MHTFGRGMLAAAAAGALVLATGVPSNGSEVRHDTVVSEDAVSWTPNLVVVSGEAKPVAYSIATAGPDMVVGGRFSQVAQTAPSKQTFDRANVVAFSATTGKIDTGFAPQVNGDVWSLLSDGTSVYIGGGFTTVNGTTRPALAKVDLATGQLDTSFNPTFTGGRVSDMAMHKGQLIVAGTFKAHLVSLNTTTGKPTSYLKNVITGKLPNSNSAQVFKFDISPDGQHLVAVGNFLTVDGSDRPRVFMLDLGADSTTLSDWNYGPLASSCSSRRVNAQAYVQDVDFSPDSSHFDLAAFGYMPTSTTQGRWFQLCDSVSRFTTNKLNPTQPDWIDYTGGDSLHSVADTGAAIYVQGHSRWLDNPYGQDFVGEGPVVERLGGGAVDPNGHGYARLGDFNAVPGEALDWNPVMPQQAGGYQILPTPAGVWFATDGARFGGETHRGIRFAPLP